MGSLIYVFGFSGFSKAPPGVPAAAIPDPSEGVTNTQALGRILYTDYIFVFQGAGLILLVAMVGAIVLTLRQKEGVKRQSIAEQVARRPEAAVTMMKVEPGKAIIPSSEEGQG